MSFCRNLFSYLGLILAVSVDGAIVGAAYGAKGLRVPASSLVRIGLATGVLMGLSMNGGRFLSQWMDAACCRFWGGAVILGLGVWQIFKARIGAILAKSKMLGQSGPVARILQEPLAADIDSSGTIDGRESVALGVALGLDAFAAGFGASLTGFSLLMVPAVAVASPLFLMLGGRLGTMAGGNRALAQSGVFPGLALIAVGIVKICQFC